MNYPTNLLRAFAVVCSWSNTEDKDSDFLLSMQNSRIF